MDIVMDYVFPSIIYILVTILLVVLIMFVIKSMRSVDKLNGVIDDLRDKSDKLNGIFTLIDTSTNLLSGLTNKLSNVLSSKIFSMFDKNKKKEEE